MASKNGGPKYFYTWLRVGTYDSKGTAEGVQKRKKQKSDRSFIVRKASKKRQGVYRDRYTVWEVLKIPNIYYKK